MQETAEKMESIISDAERFLSEIDEKGSYSVPGSKWCIKEIIGHLIDSACNNHQRFIRLQSGNMIGFPGYEQDEWVETAHYKDLEWKVIKGLWINYNKAILNIINQIDRKKLKNYWETPDMSLEFIAKDYLRHIQHHLDQVKKAI